MSGYDAVRRGRPARPDVQPTRNTRKSGDERPPTARKERADGVGRGVGGCEGAKWSTTKRQRIPDLIPKKKGALDCGDQEQPGGQGHSNRHGGIPRSKQLCPCADERECMSFGVNEKCLCGRGVDDQPHVHMPRGKASRGRGARKGGGGSVDAKRSAVSSRSTIASLT